MGAKTESGWRHVDHLGADLTHSGHFNKPALAVPATLGTAVALAQILGVQLGQEGGVAQPYLEKLEVLGAFDVFVARLLAHAMSSLGLILSFKMFSTASMS